MKTKYILIFLLVITQKSWGQTPPNYSLPQNWVLNHRLNKRLNIDPGYTIIQPDTNQRTVVNIPYDTLSNYDIFCVYPTIASGGGGSPQIHPLAFDSSTVTPLVLDLFSQYGKYGRLYAPYYRQANSLTFTSPGTQLAQASLLDTAVTDIIASFQYYFNNNNGGKKIILAGHSQGSVLLGMMLRRFESNPALYSAYMAKIVLTILPGFVTGPHTALSSNKGGWFQNYPVCQSTNDVNCMMTWQTYRNAANLGTSSPFNHIYNDSLVSWGYRYRAFDSINYQILNDPLNYTTNDTIPLTIFPNNMVNYAGVTTHYVAYQKYFKALNQQVPSDYGLKVQRTISGSDTRINPFFSLFYHIYDHYIASGYVHELIQIKLSIITGIGDVNNPDDFTVFPNPSTNGNFFIRFSNNNTRVKSWTIFNLAGQKILSGTGNNIRISHEGLFILTVITNKGTNTKKIIFKN